MWVVMCGHRVKTSRKHEGNMWYAFYSCHVSQTIQVGESSRRRKVWGVPNKSQRQTPGPQSLTWLMPESLRRRLRSFVTFRRLDGGSGNICPFVISPVLPGHVSDYGLLGITSLPEWSRNKKRHPGPDQERRRLACWLPGENIQTTWRECITFSNTIIPHLSLLSSIIKV